MAISIIANPEFQTFARDVKIRIRRQQRGRADRHHSGGRKLMPQASRKRGPLDAAVLRELTRIKQFDAITIMCAMSKDAALREALQFLDLRLLPTDRLTKRSYQKLQRWLHWIEGYPLDGLYLERASTGWCQIRSLPNSSCFAVREDDDEDDSIEGVLSELILQWRLHLGHQKEYSVRKVIECAMWLKDHHRRAFGAGAERSEALDFRDVLLFVAGKDGAINSYKLGRWLGENESRRVSGLGNRQSENSTWRAVLETDMRMKPTR
jgi:hypothetical protein